jgi:hypothetical protein
MAVTDGHQSTLWNKVSLHLGLLLLQFVAVNMQSDHCTAQTNVFYQLRFFTPTKLELVKESIQEYTNK